MVLEHILLQHLFLGLRHPCFGAFPALQYLEISESKVNSVPQLDALRNLRLLKLNYCKIKDTALLTKCKFPNLEFLELLEHTTMIKQAELNGFESFLQYALRVV